MPGDRNVFTVFALVANSPSSNVHCASRSGAAAAEALAAKLTVSGMKPLFVLAKGAQVGPPAALFFKNHGVVVGSVLKTASNWLATLYTPLLLGCVKSLCERSEHDQTSPSDRGVRPSPQMYGPQEIQGATTGPLLGL